MSNKKQIEKMLRLANIKKKSLNENSSTSTIEFIKSVADGNTYAIVRENRTYYIKSTKTKDTLLESDFDYIGGLGNRTKNSFRGYDDAVTRLNLMFNDINRSQNINEDVDMVNFSHKINENGEYVKVEPLQEKKFILKQPKPKKTKEPMDFGGETKDDEFDFGGGDEDSSDEFDFGGGDSTEDGEEDFDFGGEEDSSGDEFDFGGEEDSSGDEFDFGGEDSEEPEMDFDDEPMDSEESGDTIKDIQKTTGKLGQQLRDTEDISSDIKKWVAKSVISALKLDMMDDSDKDDIISALENGGKKSEESGDVDFMSDEYEDKAGERDLDDDEELLLDDEGPGGYLGFESDNGQIDYMNDRPERPRVRQEDNPEYTPNRRPERPRVRQEDNPEYTPNRRPERPRVRQEDNPEYTPNRKRSYMTDDDMELCEDGTCDEGMSKWNDADNEPGMGWDTNESVSYMGDEELFDNSENYDDIYGMNEPAPTKPTTKPDTDTPRPTRPSKSPFSPPSRIRPGEEPRPKAGTNSKGRRINYMASEPSPAQEPNESPTIAPPKPGTDRPTRPSKSPFTPPSRIRPGEEPRPKADYDDDVEFS